MRGRMGDIAWLSGCLFKGGLVAISNTMGTVIIACGSCISLYIAMVVKYY